MENTNSVKRLDIKIESVDWSRTFSYEITELELMGGGVITFQVPEDIPKLSTYTGVKTGATLGLAIGGSVGSLMARIARVVATGLPHHIISGVLPGCRYSPAIRRARCIFVCFGNTAAGTNCVS